MLSLILTLCCALPVASEVLDAASFATVVTQAEDIDALEQQLRDRNENERRKAVQGLVALGTDEAWGLVLEALRDPWGRVSDQAQLDLVHLPASMWPELMGKAGLQSRADLVPLRVAEALGRFDATLPEKNYVKALQHKDVDVVCSLLWSVERLTAKQLLDDSHADLIESVAKLANRAKDDRVRAHALLALGQLDAQAAQELFDDFAGSKSATLRCAAAELSARLPEEARMPAVLRAAGDEAFPVRLRAYEALAAFASKPGTEALVQALEAESRLRCAWRIVGLLRAQSGLKHELDPRPWKLWLAGLPEDWTPQSSSAAVDLGGEGTVAFIGMKVVSTRVAFLIDFSGSMWQERDGKTRKQRADVEMRRVLEGLDPGVHFNLHPYTSAPLRWQKKLTEATPRNVKGAVEYFEKCTASGTGNFWSAALEALQDPEVDTLMVLGDGAPSGGSRWNLELMKELFRHENRFRGIALDVLLVDCSKWLTSQWEEVSAASGGRCVGVDL